MRRLYIRRQLAIVIKLILNYTVCITDRKYIMIDQKKYIHFIEMYRKSYPDLQKEKQYRNAQKLCLRQEK